MAKTKRQPWENCDCVTMANKALGDKNAEIEQRTGINFTSGTMYASQPIISTAKLDSKKRGLLPILLASYCPFCGKKYKTETKKAK